MLLLGLTSVSDFLGLCVTLWLAGYLLSRGFRSPTTLRAALILFLLALTFTEGYISLHNLDQSHYAWYLGAYLLAVIVWYDLTYRWLPRPLQRRLRWTAWGIYGIGLVTLVIVFTPFSGLSNSGPGLLIGSARPTLFGLGNALMLLPAAIATLVNFRLGMRYGRGPRFQTIWLAALFGALSMSYGAVSYLLGIYLPRLGLDWLVTVAMLMLGLAVARHQAFVERRTTLQDLPVSALAVLAIMTFYALTTLQSGFSAGQIALVTALAVFTHSVYDLVREWLERLLHRQDSKLRHQLRKLARDVSGSGTLTANLHTALSNLVVILRAAGGFVAVKRGESFEVLTSVHSLPVGERLELAAMAADNLRPREGPGEPAAWLAGAWANHEQLGVIGLGPRTNAGTYPEEDLDLLMEAADSVGQLLSAEANQERGLEELMTLVTELEKGEVRRQTDVQELIDDIDSRLDRSFERLVEQCLQHLSDYTYLGQSGLASELLIDGPTHIERGKAVRDVLLQAIDSLRPAGPVPSGIPAREWFAYAILHDAYVEDVPNRDIMSKLYISESNFNRRRHNALNAVARSLLEANRPVLASGFESLARVDSASSS